MFCHIRRRTKKNSFQNQFINISIEFPYKTSLVLTFHSYSVSSLTLSVLPPRILTAAVLLWCAACWVLAWTSSPSSSFFWAGSGGSLSSPTPNLASPPLATASFCPSSLRSCSSSPPLFHSWLVAETEERETELTTKRIGSDPKIEIEPFLISNLFNSFLNIKISNFAPRS